MKIFKRIMIVIVSIIALLAVILGIYVHQNKEALKSVDTGKNSVSQKVDQDKPISVLLLGADTGTDGRVDRGNSDTMMLVTLNPKTKKSVIYSIPRDSVAEMVGDKTKNVQKINAAYNIGKSKMAKNTVSKLLNVPVDYSVAINMAALKKTVNFVGGITIKSDMKVSFDGVTVPKGTHHLNGTKALTYVRMRYQDPRGDYGRQIRQQQVLKAVVKKMAQPKYLIHLPKLIKELGPDISTDLTDKQLEEFPMKYHNSGKSIKSHQLQGKSAWINGSSYQVLPTSTLQKSSDELRENLGLPKDTVSNTETKLNKQNKSFFEDDSNTDYDTHGLDKTYYTNNTY
ncbi:LCP family glycopolymer transferase [Companilactobacillus keshanensis]|uniref:LCP family protein n=1 Tax=Companilactobacillus keshanensis TaxID=2486003 RepID=A0ABW4BW18_9LACO|nr:LCP family protein [Companilactobacillus keshanensis]